ncbi:S8 family serine peptidase [Deinococcus koreensis]|uniref:Peptidase S8 n=1 Tax=Deinococcus koreensis TaxID=2054903 RepID=A0A2K3UXL8_9DEIO|nr:S8 family serine peptidase [Deinococcus koreensis]PNY81292.1 peptidase S8 [Deinococcus koreensis]
MKPAALPRHVALTLLSLSLAACGVQQAPTAQQASALQSQSVSEAGTNETARAWFVEFREKATSKGGNRAAIAQERQAFRAQARALGLKVKDRLEFERLWNGVSVEVNAADVAKLRDLDGVKAIFPVLSVPRPEVAFGSEEPDMATAIAQTGADVAQSELGLSGRGVKVAIMDTGLDLEHPAFTGRVVASYDFVGDAFNGSNDPVAGQDTVDDCGGHGTHVAGIAAGGATANGARGVAPEASLGIYRVFGCEGSTQADIMVAAMERALNDGMDVLNMSIGSAFNSWAEYPTAVAASNLVDAGVVVAASIGNSGSGGVFSAGAPGVGEKVIGVANFMNSHVFLNEFTVGADKFGYQNATGAPTAPTSGSLELKAVTPVVGCDPLPAGSLIGKAALISRGTCTFATKAANAQNAGAAAVVIYNSTPGPFAGTVAGAVPITIPVVTVSREFGLNLATRIAAGPTSITWTPNSGSYVNPTGNTLDSSSSYGLAADLSLKPDLGAPGGLIRSAYPIELSPGGSGYAVLSGTSMSSPHVAGAAALVIEARRRAGQPIAAGDMRALLQNTAEPKPWSAAPTAGYTDFVHRQGAGMINVVRAVGATAGVTPSKLSLGENETAGGSKTQTLTVTNRGTAAVTYTLSHQGALTSGKGASGYYTPTALLPGATASFSAPTVTVPAGSSASITVTITPTSANQTVYGGYVVFTPTGAGTPLRVPYAGFQGDYQSLPILTGTKTMARANADGSFTPISTPTTFTMQGADYPSFLLHLDHFARTLKLDIVDAATMQPVHSQFFNASTDEYLPRNATPTGNFSFAWDGQVSWSRGFNGVGNTHDKRKPVPNGKYIVKITALKALGDASNPAHVETWSSPVITVNAPKK